MIADGFRDRRVFLCGDAAHIWVPFAGYGMNAGIADATNLSWMLAGVIKGWADPALLEAYEIERQPITEQVSHYAMNTALARASHRDAISDTIEQGGPEGDAMRARIGRQAYGVNVGQFCCGGLNFGYFYVGSPIIAYDGETAPAYTLDQFSQSTVPGCRGGGPSWRTDGGRRRRCGRGRGALSMQTAALASRSACCLAGRQATGRSDGIDRPCTRSFYQGVASRCASIIGGIMRAKTLAAAECEVERPYLRAALLCGLVLTSLPLAMRSHRLSMFGESTRRRSLRRWRLAMSGWCLDRPAQGCSAIRRGVGPY